MKILKKISSIAVLIAMLCTIGVINQVHASGTRDEVIEYARSYIGKVPYVWGGTDLATGVDCSGFICRVYEKFDINLWGRRVDMINLVSDGIATNEGTDINNAMLGDIIYTPGHVSLYSGNGRVVNALNSKYGVLECPATSAWIGDIIAIIRIKDSYFDTNTNQVKATHKKAASTLSIDLTDYPQSIKVGSNYGLRGTITSNYNIKKVTGQIEKGNSVIQSSTDTPNSTSLNIKSANLNNNLVFNSLSAGEYKLYIEAVDCSGKKISVTKKFTVNKSKSEQKQSSDSTLSINLEKYPVSLNVGSSYGLRGSVTSNYKISVVKGYVKNSSGKTVLSSTDKPNSTYMDIKTANLNNDLVFNNLSIGSYTMIVEATDTSGRVATAKKDFSVNAKPVSQGNASGTAVTGTVNIPASWDNLSIRSGPGTSYEIVGSMNQGAQCTVYPDKASNGWYYVSYNGIWGYASGGQIKLGSNSGSGNSSASTRIGVVNIPASWDNLSIRSGPGTSYEIVGSMNQGAQCTVYPDKASNGWYYINYNGITGYASGKQINLQ